MSYSPNAAPKDVNQISDFLNRELQTIASQWSSVLPLIVLDKLYAAPKKPREGMIVLADGTTWNPGAGAGFYGYRGGAWRLLG